jgi:hypothetical protein
LQSRSRMRSPVECYMLDQCWIAIDERRSVIQQLAKGHPLQLAPRGRVQHDHSRESSHEFSATRDISGRSRLKNDRDRPGDRRRDDCHVSAGGDHLTAAAVPAHRAVSRQARQARCDPLRPWAYHSVGPARAGTPVLRVLFRSQERNRSPPAVSSAPVRRFERTGDLPRFDYLNLIPLPGVNRQRQRPVSRS